MNVLCACDAGFIEHMATMLLSLVENNARHDIQVFVFCVGALPGIEKIATMLANRARLSLISIEPQLLANVLTNARISSAAYARLLMDEILPPGLDRILYLDCDLIVRGDLGDLWDTDLCGKTIGAVRDITPYLRHSILGLPPGAPYFNSGVLLVDLDRWQELRIGQRALDFVRRHPDRLQWYDQCALNCVAFGEWLPLDPKWNFQTLEVGEPSNDIIRFRRMNPRIRDAVRVVHFSTYSKPWHYLNYHPLKEEYLAYRRRTPWPLERFADRCPHNIIYRFLHRHMPPLLPLYLAVRKII